LRFRQTSSLCSWDTLLRIRAGATSKDRTRFIAEDLAWAEVQANKHPAPFDQAEVDALTEFYIHNRYRTPGDIQTEFRRLIGYDS
jgi:hypothetical protein